MSCIFPPKGGKINRLFEGVDFLKEKNLGGKLVLQLFVWQVRTDALLPPSPHNTFQARMRWVDVVWVDHVVCWNEFAFVNKEDWVCQSIHRCLKNHETKQ